MTKPTLKLVLTEIIRLNSKFDTLSTEVNSNTKQLQNMESRLIRLEAKVDTGFAQLTKDLLNIGSMAMNHEKRLNQHDRLFESFHQR